MVEQYQSFTATMSIHGRPVTLVSASIGPASVATQRKPTEPLLFRFYYAPDGTYKINVAAGKHQGQWIGIGHEYGLETSDEACKFFIYLKGVSLTPSDWQADDATIYMQSLKGGSVQQRMDPDTVFDDLDELFNFLLAVPKKDRGDGTYLAMIEDEWVKKPLKYNAPHVKITLNNISIENQ
nr:hypothetical protein [uncultured Pseudomonas sp.]